jgi:GntR family transcriptional regulator
MPTDATFNEIANDLKARIESGEYPPGGRLPSYRQVASLYGVSVTTAQKALFILRHEGLTYSVRGIGLFVKDPPAEG